MPSSPNDQLAALLRSERSSKYSRELLELQLDGELLLTDLGINYVRRGRELVALCPSPEHEDHSPSWSFRDDPGGERHGLHSCWGCQWGGNAAQLVASVKGLDHAEAVQYLLDLFGIEGPSEEKLYDLGTARKKKVKVLAAPPKVKTIAGRPAPERPDRLPPGARRVTETADDPFWQYLVEKRGWQPGESETYEVYGHVPVYRDERGKLTRRWFNRVILPLRMDGALRAYYGRSIDPDCPKKFKGLYPMGKGAIETVLGGWDLRQGLRRAVLVEGRLDEIHVRRVLPRVNFPADVFAVLGAQITPARAALLREYEELIVLGDGDAGGRAFGEQAYRRMKWYGRVFCPPLPEGTDPDENDDETLGNVLSDYTRYRAGARPVLTRIRYDVALRKR